MSKKKCIYKSNNQIDGVSDAPVCFEINEDTEYKDIPTTGEEYLLKVIKERKNYASLSQCNKDFSEYSINRTPSYVEFPSAQLPIAFKPTIEWQNMQVADFSDTRMYLSKMLSKMPLSPENKNLIDIDPNNIAVWKNMFEKNSPTLSCLLGLDVAMIDCGLNVLVQVLRNVKPGHTISYKTGQWTYAFLACVKLPLMCDTVTKLRELARSCAEIRSHLDPDEDNSNMAVAPLNLFICLVSRYFRQTDLAD